MATQEVFSEGKSEKALKNKYDSVNGINTGYRHSPFKRSIQVISIEKAIISSSASGTLAKVYKMEGERFIKGEKLLEIDCAVEKSQLNKVKATREKRRIVLDATRELLELNTRSPLEVNIAEAELSETAAAVDLMQVMVDRCEVLAPFSGVITKKIGQSHQFVAEGDPVYEIINDKKLELEFLVPSTWVVWLQKGYKFNIIIEETSKEYKSIVRRVSGLVDPVSKSIKVYASVLGSKSGLMPGMSGTAVFKIPDSFIGE